MTPQMIKGVCTALVVFGFDQATKYWVAANMYLGERIQVFEFFAWVRWHNEGAAFSFLSTAGGWQRWFFVVLGIGVSGFILYELRRLSKQDKVMPWAFGLILGGVFGNLLDRLINGYVVDFVLVHYQDNIFPAFNVADSALFCGAALWIFTMFREARQAADQNV